MRNRAALAGVQLLALKQRRLASVSTVTMKTAVLSTAESHSCGERCTHAWCHAHNLLGFCFVFKFFWEKASSDHF